MSTSRRENGGAQCMFDELTQLYVGSMLSPNHHQEGEDDLPAIFGVSAESWSGQG